MIPRGSPHVQKRGKKADNVRNPPPQSPLPQRVKSGHLLSEKARMAVKSMLKHSKRFPFRSNFLTLWSKLDIPPMDRPENWIFLANMQTCVVVYLHGQFPSDLKIWQKPVWTMSIFLLMSLYEGFP